MGLNNEPGLVDDTPVAADTVRDIALAEGSTWRRLVTDPVTGYAMAQVSDSYRPPPRMARAVQGRDGICRAPGCNRPVVRCELDHVHERRDGGVTAGDKLAGCCPKHHAKKTRRHWAARMRPDGVVEWRLPDGRVYPTYPMDYRDCGLHADTAHTTGAIDRTDTTDVDDTGDDVHRRETVLIDRADLEAIDADAAAAQREIDLLREALADEETAHAATRATLDALRAEHPPF